MFKPNKKKPSKAKEKVDFKLEFYATRVPQRGWDKLMVSLISLETNKVTAKTGKVAVKNGACLWSEPVFASPLLFQEAVGKEANQAPYKLLVSMGLSRFGILGEATINLADYMQAVAPVSLALQLQSCNSGSILHVKIQRVGLNIANRELEGQQDMQKDRRPPVFDVKEQCLEERSAGSLATGDKDDFASPSSLSSDSLEAPHTPELNESRPYGRDRRGREELASPCSSIGSCSGRQDLGNTIQDYSRFNEVEAANQSYHDDHSPSEEKNVLHFSLFHSNGTNCDTDRADCPRELMPWTSRKGKELEAAELTIRELRSQYTLGEQKFKQMEVQMELLEKKHGEEMTRNEELQRALTALKEEHDSVRGLRFAPNIPDQGGDGIKWSELQEELAYERSVNSNLSLQLRKTQESNSELLLEIQDLEKLLHEKDTMQQKNADYKTMVDALKKELEELERDSHELTEENMNLLSQLKQANEKVNLKEDVIAQLELKMNKESYLCAEMETEKLKEEVEELSLNLRECEESYESKLLSSRTFIDDLNSSVMMVRSKNARLERELQSSEQQISELLKEIDSLKSKMEGHEKERSLFVSQKGQLNVFREKASKAEQEYRGAIKRVEELEVINRDLKVEKSRDLTAIKKQLQDFQEHALATDSKYRDTLQAMAKLKEEKLNLDKETSTLQSAKEAAEASVTQLQSLNKVLQEKLHAEQGKNAELLQECKDKEVKNTQLLEEVKAMMTQMKVLEQTAMELETSGKEVEANYGSMQAENTACRSRIKELEVQVESLEGEKFALQSLRSAFEARLQELEALNEELSEKLKNAQEDIDWTRENTNTLVNEIRELEGELKSDMMIQQHLKKSISDLESQKMAWQSQLDELLNKNARLEKDVLILEERCKDVSNERDALLVAVEEQKRERHSSETSFHIMIKQQEDKIQQLLASGSENKIQQVLQDASMLRDEKLALENELTSLQDTLMQAKKDVCDGENKVKRALLEASMRTDEKLELEGNVLKLEEMLKQAEKDASSLKQNLDFQFQEAAFNEQDMMKKLNKATMEAQLLQDEKLEFLQKIMGLEAQCAAVELERRKASMAMLKMETDLEALQREKEGRERVFADLEAQCAATELERKKLSVAMSKMETELEALQWGKEGTQRAFADLEAQCAATELERRKLSMAMSKMETELEALQRVKEERERAFADLEAQFAATELERRRLSTATSKMEADLEALQREKDDKERAFAGLKEEKETLKVSLGTVFKIESDLEVLQKEKEVRERAFVSLKEEKERLEVALRVVERETARESADLCEKVEVLEGELKMKVAELELLRLQLEEGEAQLSSNNEQVEEAKRQLPNHLSSLQNQNAAQREIEPMCKITSEEALQREIKSLKEKKRVLELALSNFSAAANGDYLSKKIAALETELAEVLEANNMYKMELQSVFAKQHNVHKAALEKLGSVEQVIQDLADLKKKNMLLEDELKDMRQRYFNMSLQFAEVEAEREELVMTIRNLRGAKKLMPHKSVNF